MRRLIYAHDRNSPEPRRDFDSFKFLAYQLENFSSAVSSYGNILRPSNSTKVVAHVLPSLCEACASFTAPDLEHRVKS
jgi:hypothetical protein